MILEKDKPEKIKRLVGLNIAKIYTTYDCIKLADIIIFAVKPQDCIPLFEAIAKHVQNDQILLSLMAGVKISSIQRYFKTTKIVRAMPNLPSKIGFGVTGYTSSPDASRVELNIIHNLLSNTGRAIYIEKEEQIDAVTAISGSGPAYVFYFMQSMINSALELGLNEAQAELLVKQTFFGSINLYQQSNLSCSEWIKQVSSKGGTTQAAIDTFSNENLDNIIKQGIESACNRAIELGNMNS
jgi:pyrroline-5-carboxylate reductase